MDTKTKIFGISAIILALAIMGFIIKYQYETIKKLEILEKKVDESKDIGNGIIRSQTIFASKDDLEKIIKDNNIDLSAIKDDLKNLGADIKAINTVKITTPGYTGNSIPSDITTPRIPETSEPSDITTPSNITTTLNDPYKYQLNTQWINLSEPLGNGQNVPIGKTGFSAWSNKPWSVEILPRKYESVTVLGQDEDGKNYSYSKFTITSNGQTFTAPISDAKLIQEMPSASFKFNPRLYLTTDVGAIISPKLHAEVMPGIGLSFLSYGKTKAESDWNFLILGLGYTPNQSSGAIFLSPINYNLGKAAFSPLIRNLFVGPSVSIDTTGNFGLYLGIKVGL